MRGPKPQPTKLKILRGIPGKRRLPENEPILPPVLPEPPEFVQGAALQEWHRIAPLLHGAPQKPASHQNRKQSRPDVAPLTFHARRSIRLA